jgi:membrane protein DedA with SNARE-associated domain
VDQELWHLVLLNFITPTYVIIFPLRMAVTIATATTHHWLIVTELAVISGSLGMIPVYAMTRWWAANRWNHLWQENNGIIRWRQRLRRRMFLYQIVLNVIQVPDPGLSALAGCEKYPLKRFLLAQLIGRHFHVVPLVLYGTAFKHVPFFQPFIAAMQQVPWFHRALVILSSPWTSIILIAAITIIALIRLWQKKNLT